MTIVRSWLVAVLVSVVLSHAAHGADMAAQLPKFPAPTAADREKLCAELFKEGAAGIQSLCKMLVEPGNGNDDKVRLALAGMAIHASRPGGDADRKLFAQTVAAELSGSAKVHVKTFLLEQLRLTAGDEQVPEIAKLLSDNDLSDQAAQTLLTIRTPSVATALRAALGSVKDGPRVTVINALGTLQDKDSAADILKDAENPNADVRSAALRALANIGDASSASVFAKAVNVTDLNKRGEALEATLALAQRLVELGKKSEAAAICRSLTKLEIPLKESHLQCAALTILASAETDAAFDDLKTALKSESGEVRATALSIAGAIPGAAVTQRWAAELKGADPRFATEILAVLERRNDPSAFSAVADAAKSNDASVRAAAYRAAVIGGKNALPLLLAELKSDASKDNADELAAARTSLSHLKGDGVGDALAAALQGATPSTKKDLIAALSERNAVEHVGDLVAAATDADPTVRAAAFEGLAAIGSVKELPAMLSVLVKAEKDEDRTSAEKAAGLIASRSPQKATVATQVSSAMTGASVKARQSLLRVLGRTGGTEALAALKPSLTLTDAAEADVVDTAVRELANWPDSSAETELLDVAKASKDLPHNVLALNGYVRLLDAETKRPSNDFLPRYKAALELCRRPEEKKKVISGIQNVKTLEGAKFVEELMADDSMREEACNAAMNIAKELAKTQKDAARGVFEKVIATTKRADLKKNAQGEIDKLGK